MKRNQGGMTLVGFIIVLAVVGLFAYVGMKLFPMYQEFYSVKKALAGLKTEPGIADQDPGKIEDLFFRRLYVSYSDSVGKDNVKVERMEGGWKMTVDYEVRKPMIYNLDVVGKFHAEENLTRSSGNPD